MLAAPSNSHARPEVRRRRGRASAAAPAEPNGLAGAIAAPLPLDPAREGARRWVVRLVFALVLLAILEGAIRKWVVPQFGTYVFFVRDPILLLAYAVATRHGLWPRSGAWMVICWGMAAFGVLLMLLQFGSGGYSEHRVILGVYGWRAYFLYVPLAFLVASSFRADDLRRLFTLLLWIAVPIAFLVAAQFASPQGAAINVGSSEDQALQFKGLGLNAERTRPMGPFASGAGQQQFGALAFVLLLAYFISPSRITQPRVVVLLITGAGVLTCVALSGSRGLVLQCGVAVAVALSAGVIGRGSALTARAFLWPALITAGALVAYPLVFPEGYSAFMDRWAAADAAESRTFESTGVFGRALFGVIDFVRYLNHTPAFGYGLGFGGNAAITLNARIDGQPAPYAETDFARHMVDLGPVFGFAYIAFRLAVLAYVTRLAVMAARDRGDPMPLMLWSYVAYILLMGQITGQGTINFFGWLATGLLMASAASRQHQAGTHLSSTPGTLSPAPTASSTALPTPRGPLRPAQLRFPQSRTLR